MQLWKVIGEFPKIEGTLFWGPYNKDPTISGTILGSPIFGNSHTLLSCGSSWDVCSGGGSPFKKLGRGPQRFATRSGKACWVFQARI